MREITIALLTGMVLAAVPARAIAQDDADAHDAAPVATPPESADAATLAARVADLEARLAEALAENARLRRLVDQLQDVPADSGAAPALVAPLGTDELASPDALFRAVRASYETQVLAALPPGEHLPTMEAVEAWAQACAEAVQGRRRWVARLTLDEPAGDDPRRSGRTALVALLDEATLSPRAAPFTVTIPARNVARLRASGADALWIVDATLAAAPEVNPRRAEVGPFDHPRYIGPYAEFNYELTVLSVRRTTEDAVKERARGVPDSDDAGRVR